MSTKCQIPDGIVVVVGVLLLAGIVSARAANATECTFVTTWLIEFSSIEQVDDMELDEGLLGDERRNWFTNGSFDQSNTDIPEYNVIDGYRYGVLLLRPREP